MTWPRPIRTPILAGEFWPRHFLCQPLVIWKDWHRNRRQFSHPVWGLCSFQHFIFKIFVGVRQALMFLKAQAAKVNKKPAVKPRDWPQTNANQQPVGNPTPTSQTPENAENEPNQLSSSTITISGMPVSENVKKQLRKSLKSRHQKKITMSKIPAMLTWLTLRKMIPINYPVRRC